MPIQTMIAESNGKRTFCDQNMYRDRRDFENELIKKLNAKRFLKHINKSERRFGATLSHYQVKNEKVYGMK